MKKKFCSLLGAPIAFYAFGVLCVIAIYVAIFGHPKNGMLWGSR